MEINILIDMLYHQVSSKISYCSFFWFPSYVNKINQSNQINQSAVVCYTTACELSEVEQYGMWLMKVISDPAEHDQHLCKFWLIWLTQEMTLLWPLPHTGYDTFMTYFAWVARLQHFVPQFGLASFIAPHTCCMHSLSCQF